VEQDRFGESKGKMGEKEDIVRKRRREEKSR